jgi:hypothetical protein
VCKYHTPYTPTTAVPHIAYATPVALLQHYGCPSANSLIPPGTAVCSGGAADLSCDLYRLPAVLNAVLSAAMNAVWIAVVLHGVGVCHEVQGGNTSRLRISPPRPHLIACIHCCRVNVAVRI